MSKWDEIAAQAHERWKAGQPNQPIHPRCETCRWWNGERGDADPDRDIRSGECVRHTEGDAPEPFFTEAIYNEEDGCDRWAQIFTEHDFYCLAWDAKDAQEKEDRT